MPVHNWKYAPIVRRATEMLRSGAIGQLREVEIETLRIQDCAVADPDHQNWRRDPAIAGGGVLMDHGWHAIYLARHWFGEAPSEVRASLHRPTPEGVEDEATLTLVFPSGHAKIFLTWRADVRRNTMRLIGERGEIAIDDDTLRIAEESIQFESALSAGSHHADWFAAMLPDVIASFHRPEAALESFDEAALCLSVIRRAYQMRSGWYSGFRLTVLGRVVPRRLSYDAAIAPQDAAAKRAASARERVCLRGCSAPRPNPREYGSP